MPHDTPLIATIVAGLGLAFLFGLLAHRLRLPTLAGYLLAGVLIGPFTPGYVADQHLASELAEIGVILLMFGVGLHFSLKDLMSVRTIAIPGAIGQIGVATGIGAAFGWLMGWGWGGGLIFGLSLSVASTVVLLRALQERQLVESERGRIAVGWLIVEDLVMVVALVLIPPLAGVLGGDAPAEADAAHAAPAVTAALSNLGLGPIGATLALTGVKVASFVALMLVVGRRLIPWALHHVAHTGSRELFRLAVLAIALGVAYGSARLFDVSFALGAFFAGMVMAGSPLSSRAANETLPLRDAFAVLFFVSVGMLFNPWALIEDPLALALTVLVIVGAKSIAAFAIVRLFGHGRETALTIAASLAQIGEFSFILAVLGTGLGILPDQAQDLIVAGALISILVNPLVFRLAERRAPKPKPKANAQPQPEVVDAPAETPAAPVEEEIAPSTKLSGHAVVMGYGRVGRRVAAGLVAEGLDCLVVEHDATAREAARDAGFEVLAGLGHDQKLLARLNLAEARCLVLAVPDAIEAGVIIDKALALNPGLLVLGRASSDAEIAHLEKAGAERVVMGENELAQALIAAVLARKAEPAPAPEPVAAPAPVAEAAPAAEAVAEPVAEPATAATADAAPEAPPVTDVR